MTPLHGRLLFFLSLCVVGLCSSPSFAEPAKAQKTVQQWLFVDAWTTFRRDLDASVPGAHGQVLLAEQLQPVPPWIVRDALRLSAAPPVILIFARKAAQSNDGAAINALQAALGRAQDERSQRGLERALVALGDKQLRLTMAKRLRSASGPARWHAASTLAIAGKSSMPLLRTALSDPDGQTRIVAATALATRGDSQAKALLVKLLGSSNPFEQTEAALGLARAGDKRALPILRKKVALAGPDQLRAAHGLGLIGAPPDVPVLVKVLKSIAPGRSTALRQSIYTAVGRIVTRAQLPGIQKMLSSKNPDEDPTGRASAWLRAVGRGRVQGAKTSKSLAAKVSKSLEGALPHESKSAFERRKALNRPLVDALLGKAIPAVIVPAPANNVPSLETAIRYRGSDPQRRIRRFQAAAALMDILGTKLGHPGRADPPNERFLGLNAHLAADGNPMTAWVAGKMAGELQIVLGKARKLKRVEIISGCISSKKAYRTHGRVKKILVLADNGASAETTLIDGLPYFQPIHAPATPAQKISLKVVSTFPSKNKAPACITEVRIE